MTVHYEFPCMQWWHTAAKHFEGNENFVIVDKGEYFVVNYVRAGKETHPEVTDYRTAALREGRGLIFCSKTGQLLSRPFHKFFNLGEREDLVPDFSRPHVILTKLDGSMVRPIVLESGVRWGTKMGITDVSMQAEEFVATRPQYESLARALHNEGYTPIFEWCSRKQRIVVDYPEDNLILLAVRDNFTGKYADRNSLEQTADIWEVPLVSIIDTSDMSTDDLVMFVRSMSGMEGVVIQFDDGHMVKIKADEYVSLHRAKSLLDNERDVVGLVLDEKVDDLLPLLPNSDRRRLRKFEVDIWLDILKFQSTVNGLLKHCADHNISRKEFALNSNDIEPMLRAAVFKHFELEVCNIDYIVEIIRHNLGSRAAFSKLNGILKTASWKEVKTDA